MRFEQCKEQDVEDLMKLYDSAILFQREVSNYCWHDFSLDGVMTEVKSGLIWKILKDDEVCGSFVLLTEDPYIWDELECGNAVYLHRIISSKKGTGKLMSELLEWARNYAKQLNRTYVRMDTWSENKKLADYYIQLGFESLGVHQPKRPQLLPSTYSSTSLILLQIESNH